MFFDSSTIHILFSSILGITYSTLFFNVLICSLFFFFSRLRFYTLLHSSKHFLNEMKKILFRSFFFSLFCYSSKSFSNLPIIQFPSRSTVSIHCLKFLLYSRIFFIIPNHSFVFHFLLLNSSSFFWIVLNCSSNCSLQIDLVI